MKYCDFDPVAERAALLHCLLILDPPKCNGHNIMFAEEPLSHPDRSAFFQCQAGDQPRNWSDPVL